MAAVIHAVHLVGRPSRPEDALVRSQKDDIGDQDSEDDGEARLRRECAPHTQEARGSRPAWQRRH